MKRFLEAICQNIIANVLVIIFTSTASFVASYGTIEKFFTCSLPSKILISVSITSFVAFICLILYYVFTKKFIILSRINLNYKITKKEAKFTYGRRASRYEALVSLKFKRNCREYYGRFYWSGSGEGKIKIKNRGFTLNILKRRTRYIEYVIVFDRTYRKGESVTLNLFGIMDDETGQFSPYFSTTIDTPTDTLVIKLEIDYKKYPIEQIEREIIPPQCFDHTGAEKIDVQVEGEYVWEIPKPRVSYQYSFNWTFASKKDSLYEREGVKMGD